MNSLVRHLLFVAFASNLITAAEAQPASIVDAKPLLLRESVWQESHFGSLVLADSAATQIRSQDSVLNGVLIGAGVGGVLGLIPDYFDDCEECHDSLYASIAVGAGVGLLIDLLRRDNRPTDSAVPGVPVQLAITVRSVGVLGAIRWR